VGAWGEAIGSLIHALLPIYLRGVSTGDFHEALAALLGKDAPIAGRDRVGFCEGVRAYRRPETRRAIRLVEEITPDSWFNAVGRP
jgi:hypothetical protein